MVLLSESSTEATGSNKLNLTDNELNTPMKQKNGSNYPCDGIRRALAGIYRSERGPLPINQQGGGGRPPYSLPTMLRIALLQE
jgi:hypothetical protein